MIISEKTGFYRKMKTDQNQPHPEKLTMMMKMMIWNLMQMTL